MSYKKKITKEEVLDILEKNDVIRVGEIANILDCSSATVRKRLNELKLDGYLILPQLKKGEKRGIILIESIEDEDSATLVINCAKWLGGILRNVTIQSKLTMSEFTTAIEYLDLDEDELQRLKVLGTRLGYICEGLLLDKKLNNKELPFNK